METTMETTMHSWTLGFGIIPILILLALVVIPYWKIWERTSSRVLARKSRLGGCGAKVILRAGLRPAVPPV